MLTLRLAAAAGGGVGRSSSHGRLAAQSVGLSVRWQRRAAPLSTAKRLALVSQEDGAKYKRSVYSVEAASARAFRVDRIHEGALTSWPSDELQQQKDGEAAASSSARQAAQQAWNVLWDMFMPKDAHVSVTKDYFPYAKWFFFSSVVSSAAGVLSMQSLLYAIGLGAGSIPTAAAVNWVLKDGVGQFGGVIFARCVRSELFATAIALL